MNFDFTSEQYALRDVARELFEKEFPASRLRAVWEADGDHEDDVWRRLAATGITGLTVPEPFGGQGGTLVDLVLVLEEAGRAGLPDPIVDTVAVVAPLIAASGSDAQKDRWLPGIAAGDVRATAGGPGPVTGANTADLVLFGNATEGHFVPRSSFRITRQPTVDRARPLCVVEADTSEDTRLDASRAVVARAAERGAVATAAFLNGVSMRLLEMTLEHVKTRSQFGVAIGSFQAIKHKLADMHGAVEAARPAAWYAAYADARGQSDAAWAASVAKVAAADAQAIVNREALQCHAGIGFTWEHDLHFWLKRGLALTPVYGTPAQHRARLARRVFERKKKR